MKLQPLADRLVAQPIEVSDKTAGGFYIPEASKGKTQKGKVLAVGSGIKEVKAGDEIYYAQYGPSEIDHAGEKFLVLKEEDVLAVIKG